MDDKVKCKDCLFLRTGNICMHAWHSGEVQPEIMRECAQFQYNANDGKNVGDNVNSPSHYNQGGVECIEALKAALGDKFIGFLVGNVLKYCWRYQHKNGLEDLRKAQYYLNRAIEEMSNEQPVP